MVYWLLAFLMNHCVKTHGFLFVFVLFLVQSGDQLGELQRDESLLSSKIKFSDSVKKLKQKSQVGTKSFISITDINFI